MRTILYLGICFCVAIGLQIAVEMHSLSFSLESETEQIDSDNTHFKIIDGKIYFLSNQSRWVERNNYVWQNEEGRYYKHLNGRIFYSTNGHDWKLIANLKVDKNIELPFASSN